MTNLFNIKDLKKPSVSKSLRYNEKIDGYSFDGYEIKFTEKENTISFIVDSNTIANYDKVVKKLNDSKEEFDGYYQLHDVYIPNFKDPKKYRSNLDLKINYYKNIVQALKELK